MAEFKVVIADTKSGKSKQLQLSSENSKALIGKKIKETFKGETIDLPGYELEITGGSDHAGFPMRPDVPGAGRKKILAGKSVGIRKLKNKSDRIRKTVCGNTIHEKTAQINIKILKMGPKNIFEEEKAEEAPAEGDAAASEKKEKKEEPKKEAPAEEEKKE